MHISVVDRSKDRFVNARGAVVYFDVTRHPMVVPGTELRVLSTGCHPCGKDPIVTCLEAGKVKVYRLPNSLLRWVERCVVTAQVTGVNPFPRDVLFTDDEAI